LQGAAEKPQPGFSGSPLAASRARMLYVADGSQSLDERVRMPAPTVTHRWFMDIYDHWSLISLESRAVKNNLFDLTDRYPYFPLLLNLTALAQHKLHANICSTAVFAERKLAGFVCVLSISFWRTPFSVFASPVLHP
jgi:hypothetical protein